MRINKILFLLLMGAVIFAGGCASRKREKLIMGLMPDFDSIPFMLAQTLGYLPSDIELTVFMSPLDRDSALYAGGIDGTISDALAACLAREGGFDVFIVCGTDGAYGVLTGAQVDSAKALEGREAGMSLNTIIEYVTDRIVAEDGGDPDKVLKVSVPLIPSRLELLGSGQLFAVAVPEPYVAAGLARGFRLANGKTSADMGINPGVTLFTRKALENKKDAITALLDGYDKAVEYINSHEPEEYMELVIQGLGLPAEASLAVLPDYSAAGPPEEDEVLSAMEWLYDKGLLKNTYTYEELVWDPDR